MGELFQPTHLLLVAIIAMIFLGPKRLPELGKGLGEGIRGFRDSLNPTPQPDPKDEPKQVE
jgi:sec-independent protein translocase protein TatA